MYIETALQCDTIDPVTFRCTLPLAAGLGCSARWTQRCVARLSFLQAKKATPPPGQAVAGAGQSPPKVDMASISEKQDAPAPVKKPEPAPPPVVNLIDLMDGPAAAPVPSPSRSTKQNSAN